MALRTGWFVLGLGLVGAGSLLLVRALDHQASASAPALPKHPTTGAVYAEKPEAPAPIDAHPKSALAAPSASAATATRNGAPANLEATAVQHADAPAATASALASSGAPAGDGVVFRFSRGAIQLSTDEQQRLVALSKKLARAPGVRVDIAGYNDDQDPDVGAKTLAYRRAASVQRLLVYLGVSASRLTYGAHAPAGASDPSGTVRLTLDPSLAEAGQP